MRSFKLATRNRFRGDENCQSFNREGVGMRTTVYPSVGGGYIEGPLTVLEQIKCFHLFS